MLVWLVKDGEILPLEPGAMRMRTGLLARELTRRGHDVLWWSSTFDHQRKILHCSQDADVDIEPRLRLKLLHAGRYSRNISAARVVHHRRLAGHFAHAARTLPRPDVIVTAFPIIEVAHEAVRFGRHAGIPVVVDVRDLWPDTLVERCPPWSMGVVRRLLVLEYRRARESFRGASSVVAISRGCLDWGLQMGRREIGPLDRVFVIGYPGGSSATASPRLADLWRRIAGKIVLVFVGSFGHSYEVKLVCEVASEIQKMGLDRIHFVLVGDGQQFGDVQKLAGRLGNLTLTGWLRGADVEAVLARSHVGLIPCDSVAHAVSNKFIQYLASGLPVVSSLEGEMERLIESHTVGLSYPPGNAQALLRHVVELATDEARRRRMAANARRLFAQRFDAANVYAAYADHVEHMATVGPRVQDAQLG